jgi:hypothetical protein
MIEELHHFTALIQFMGAFNFANVYCKFHDTLSKHFFNTEEVFNKQFEKHKSQIITNKESINNMKTVETTDGRSNEDSIRDLREAYDKLQTRHIEEMESLNSVCERHKPHYMQPLFLVIGVYSISVLLITALLGVYNDSFYIESVLTAFNSVTFFYAFYFPLCDVLLFYKVFNCPFFRPTLLSSFSNYIIFILIVYGFLIIDNLYLENSIINSSFLGFISWGPVYLPFSSFLLCIMLVIYYTVKVRYCVRKMSNIIVTEYEKLHQEKLSIDIFYNTFKKIELP